VNRRARRHRFSRIERDATRCRLCFWPISAHLGNLSASIEKLDGANLSFVLHCNHTVVAGPLMEADVSYALFFQEVQIGEVFLTKAEAWAFAEKSGHVALVPSREEDPPRRILNLNYSIRRVAGDLGSGLARPQTLPSPDHGTPNQRNPT
jgi:hypothetical protein